MPKMKSMWLVLLLASITSLCLYHTLWPYLTRSPALHNIPSRSNSPNPIQPSSQATNQTTIDLKVSRWKMRLQKKWDLYYKMKQLQASELLDEGSVSDQTEIPYVSLSSMALWDLKTLRDYFADQPVCTDKNGVVPFLLVIITSALDHFDQRRAIRETWANGTIWKSSLESLPKQQGRWKVIFLLGKAYIEDLDSSIDDEMSDHGDILRGNYTDSYRNLTLKVLHGLDYAATACRPAFVLKTDDDCFVNLPLLLRVLSLHNLQRKGLYIGEVNRKSKTKVVRDPDNKWHVSSQMYPLDHYPPYPSGHGYIVSCDLLDKLLDASARFRPFPNEDAYIGVLMNAIGIRPLNTHRFTLHSHNWRPCNLLYLLVIHHVSPNGQKALLDMSLTSKQKCPGQTEVATW